MRLALSQFCLPELSTRDFLDVVVRAGAEGCELAVVGGHRAPEDPKAMIAAARRSPIPIESVNVLRDWALPDDPDCRPVFDMLVEVAVETSCPFIVCVAPIRYENMPPHKDVLAAAADRLAIFAELAEPVGVRLALEQVGLSSTRLGAQSGISSLADALAVVEAAGPSVALALDSYNVATGGNRFEEMRADPAGADRGGSGRRWGRDRLAARASRRRGAPARVVRGCARRGGLRRRALGRDLSGEAFA